MIAAIADTVLATVVLNKDDNTSNVSIWQVILSIYSVLRRTAAQWSLKKCELSFGQNSFKPHVERCHIECYIHTLYYKKDMYDVDYI